MCTNVTLEMFQSLEEPTAREKRANVGLWRSGGVACDGVSGEERRCDGRRGDGGDVRFLRDRVEGEGASIAARGAATGIRVGGERWSVGC